MTPVPRNSAGTLQTVLALPAPETGNPTPKTQAPSAFGGESVVPGPDMRDLGESFRQLFELTPALDAASLVQVVRIRHDVYCRDLGREPLPDDGRESDGFDRRLFHCQLRRRGTTEPVGCARLILARPEDPDCPLPFEESCNEVLDRSLSDPARMPRDTVGEVSRLAVLNTFRQRKGESSSPSPVSDQDFGDRGPTTRFPFVPVSLYLGVLRPSHGASASSMSSCSPSRGLQATSSASASKSARWEARSNTAARACRPCAVRQRGGGLAAFDATTLYSHRNGSAQGVPCVSGQRRNG